MFSRFLTLLSPLAPLGGAAAPASTRSVERNGPGTPAGSPHALPERPPQFTRGQLPCPSPSPARLQVRQQQLIGLALENLQCALRRASASDVTAAAIDLTRVAHSAGRVPRDLLNASDPSGDRVLHQLAHAKLDVAEKLALLLRLGCDLHVLNRGGENILHAAARQNNVALIDALAAHIRLLIGERTARTGAYRVEPLGAAVYAGQPAAVRKLVLLGAGLRTPCCTDMDGTPLTAQELYARLDKRTPEMSAVLRTGRPRTG